MPCHIFQGISLLLICILVLLLLRRRTAVRLGGTPLLGHALKLRRIPDQPGGAGEVLLLYSSQSTFWQLDTGYAGPPVLSTTYLAYLQRNPIGTSLTSLALSFETQYHRLLEELQREEHQKVRNTAADVYARAHGCDAYTSGCTMRLMSISTTVEQQADMFMCRMLAFEAGDGRTIAPRRDVNGPQADVLVTNPLPGSVHILTADYLFHLAPCCIHMAAERLETRISSTRAAMMLATEFKTSPVSLVGGALAVSLEVGGRNFTVTVDTGAPGSICLARETVGTFACTQMGGSLQQTGVNAETVCSTLVSANVTFYGRTIRDAVIFVNDRSVEHTDGYVGMGFLRAFDMFITNTRVGFRPSGLDIRHLSDYRVGSAMCPAHAGVLTGCAPVPS